MISITKVFEFAAAHQLPNHQGLCKKVHGHTYKVEVEVTGEIKKEGASKGMVMDFSDLKRIVNSAIVDRLDHSFLNDIFENPTAELMLEEMVTTLGSYFVHLDGVMLVRLRLWETPTSYAEWRRNGKT